MLQDELGFADTIVCRIEIFRIKSREVNIYFCVPVVSGMEIQGKEEKRAVYLLELRSRKEAFPCYHHPKRNWLDTPSDTRNQKMPQGAMSGRSPQVVDTRRY